MRNVELSKTLINNATHKYICVYIHSNVYVYTVVLYTNTNIYIYIYFCVYPIYTHKYIYLCVYKFNKDLDNEEFAIFSENRVCLVAYSAPNKASLH